jgi:AcrR family transcriptional regulator
LEKAKNVSLWAEQGYSLFAEEGLEGIQVERLARILQLNKSGFYHYFGDMEGFLAEIVKLHEVKVNDFLREVAHVKQLDPDYLQLVIKHTAFVMFQVHLTHEKNKHGFYHVAEVVDQRISVAIQHLWRDFLGVGTNSELAIRYYNMVRDTFYMRINFQKLGYPFLHDLVTESKQLVTELVQTQSLQANKVHR